MLFILYDILYLDVVTRTLFLFLEIKKETKKIQDSQFLIPKCSFLLKPYKGHKIYKSKKENPRKRKKGTLASHIRKVRLERNETTPPLRQIIGCGNSLINCWENDIYLIHPKYVSIILEYLGYIPKIQFGRDYIGVYTQIYRLEKGLTLEEFSQLTQVDLKNIIELEAGKKKASLNPIVERLKTFFIKNQSKHIKLFMQKKLLHILK